LLQLLRPSSGHLPFKDLARRIQPPGGLRRGEWERHENGGGWVKKTASVAATAYVGPSTIISGRARVLDFAQIRDDAVVTGDAVVAGHALVGGAAHVGGWAKIVGTARVLGQVQVAGVFCLAEGELRDGIHRPLDRVHQKLWKECPTP